MGIETSLGNNKKGKKSTELGNKNNPDLVRNPNPLVNTNGKGKKGRRRQQKRSPELATPVQRLYDTCKEVFTTSVAGIVPSPENIEKLRKVLDDIEPADVGLNPDMAYFRKTAAGRTPAIRYLHLHECDKFSMGIFCLPPSSVIPLHNHPGMTVFSKLLFGTMHIKSYDWVANPSELKRSEVQQPEVNQSEVMQPEIEQPEVIQQPEVQKVQEKLPEAQQPEVRLAKVKVDSDFTVPCNTSILYPAEGGNMHCFTALTACAVLDVLGPPYCEPDDRDCQYYFDFPFSDFSVDGISVPEEERESYAWLRERDFPENLAVVRGMYTGPKIVEK